MIAPASSGDRRVGEVELAIRGHRLIRDAAVLEIGPGVHRRLLAYVLHRAATDAEIGELLSHVERVFSGLDVTPIVVLLSGLLHGRYVDAARNEPDDIETASSSAGAVDELLQAIWAEVLDRDIRHDDDFSEIGGRSLDALRAIARIEAILRVRVPLDRVLTHSSVSRLAEVLTSDERSRDDIARMASAVMRLLKRSSRAAADSHAI